MIASVRIRIGPAKTVWRAAVFANLPVFCAILRFANIPVFAAMQPIDNKRVAELSK